MCSLYLFFSLSTVPLLLHLNILAVSRTPTMRKRCWMLTPRAGAKPTPTQQQRKPLSDCGGGWDHAAGCGSARPHGGGSRCFVACLSHVTIAHASLRRRSTVPNPSKGTSNVWVLISFLQTLHTGYFFSLSLTPSLFVSRFFAALSFSPTFGCTTIKCKNSPT